MTAKYSKLLLCFTFLISVALIPQMVLAGGAVHALDPILHVFIAIILVIILLVVFVIYCILKKDNKK